MVDCVKVDVLNLAQEFAEDTSHTIGGCIGSTNHIVTIIDEVVVEVPTFIRDYRHTEDTNTSVTSYDYLGDSTHTDGITARACPVVVLRWSLVRRTRKADIHPFMYVDT